MTGMLFDPNVPLGVVQIRYRGQVIAEFECDPNDSAEILRRQEQAVRSWMRNGKPDASKEPTDERR